MASKIEISPGDPSSPEAMALLDSLSTELASITGRDGRSSFAAADVMVPQSVFLLAYQNGSPVGCGALRPISNEACEIKRMYVCHRSQGIGSAILKELEKRAFEFGYGAVWLETGIQNQKAINFYLRNGYAIRENFGKYQGRSECVCFEKSLKIRLRSLSLSDSEEVWKLWRDQEAVRWTNWPHLTKQEDCTARLERVLRFYENPMHFGPYAICFGKDSFLGIMGGDAVAGSPGTYDIWYFLKRELWGRGFAGLAVSDLLNTMRASKRVKFVTATAVTENDASWRLLERNGFTREGVLAGGHTKHGLNLDLFKYKLEL